MMKKRFCLLTIFCFLGLFVMQARKYVTANDLQPTQSVERERKIQGNAYENYSRSKIWIDSRNSNNSEGSLRGMPDPLGDPEWENPSPISEAWMLIILFSGIYFLVLNFRKNLKKELQ